MTEHARSGWQVAATVALVGIGLGAVMGVIWWLVAPTVQWTVVDGGLVPIGGGDDAWFGADGWFIGLGLVFGVLLVAVAWPLGRNRPIALSCGVVVGLLLLALAAWSLGSVLGPTDAESAAEGLPVGDVVDSALTLSAWGALVSPLLSGLPLLILLLGSRSAVEATALDS